MSATPVLHDKPQREDLDHCVHCGLCLNACPTYRQLGLEMDSPRGRIYQMVEVSEGRMPVNDDYVEHIGFCLACRACETACPSGVQYGRLVEAARAQIETERPAGFVQRFLYGKVLRSPWMLKVAGYQTWLYQKLGLQALVRTAGLLKPFGNLAAVERLAPPSQPPFFFSEIGKTFPAEGERKYRVAFLAGCIANVSFARMNEATVRVLQKNGCEVVLPEGQGCCGALHVHAGMRDMGREQALRNMDAVDPDLYDAVITNAAGCGSTLKEYPDLFERDPEQHARAQKFKAKMKDVTEFLAEIDLPNRKLRSLGVKVTYQDSCHLLHGQKVRNPPRKLLGFVPGVEFRELPLSEICCGSAGVYNVQHTDMSMKLLEDKMAMVDSTQADVIVTANPGCMLQLQAGDKLFAEGRRRVLHVVELLDEAYG